MDTAWYPFCRRAVVAFVLARMWTPQSVLPLARGACLPSHRHRHGCCAASLLPVRGAFLVFVPAQTRMQGVLLIDARCSAFGSVRMWVTLPLVCGVFTPM